MINITNNFKTLEIYTTLFYGREVKISTILFDFIVSHGTADKDYLKFIFNHISNHNDILYLDIKSVNQHYLMQSVQQEWEHHIIVHNDNFNTVMSGLKSLTEVGNMKSLQTLSSSNNIGTKDDTFTVFKENCIIYNENGIVDFLEKIICNLEICEISSLSELELKFLSYFFEGCSEDRINKIKDFTDLAFNYFLLHGKEQGRFNIDKFILKFFASKKAKLFKKIEFEDNSISLNTEWLVNFKLPSFEHYHGDIYFLPINKKIGIFIISNVVLYKEIEKKINNKLITPILILINAIKIEIDRVYETASKIDEILDKKYFKNSKIGIPHIDDFNKLDALFLEKYKISLKNIPTDYYISDLSDSLFEIMTKLERN